MLEFGTMFPSDLSAVNNKVEEINDAGHAVHTVQILLNNGMWQVTIVASNEDLDDVTYEMWLDHFGGISTPLKKIT